mmetsp:Transcript_76497/g.171148  ORF Transcript_76497/g.171148 Transcript_76497/m.171148 type:complete len:289 (-) Transcript_76497:604-1470(-)
MMATSKLLMEFFLLKWWWWSLEPDDVIDMTGGKESAPLNQPRLSLKPVARMPKAPCTTLSSLCVIFLISAFIGCCNVSASRPPRIPFKWASSTKCSSSSAMRVLSRSTFRAIKAGFSTCPATVHAMTMADSTSVCEAIKHRAASVLSSLPCLPKYWTNCCWHCKCALTKELRMWMYRTLSTVLSEFRAFRMASMTPPTPLVTSILASPPDLAALMTRMPMRTLRRMRKSLMSLASRADCDWLMCSVRMTNSSTLPTRPTSKRMKSNMFQESQKYCHLRAPNRMTNSKR